MPCARRYEYVTGICCGSVTDDGYGSVADSGYVLDSENTRDEAVAKGYRVGLSNTGGESMGKKRTGPSAPRKVPDTYSVPEAGRIVGLGKNASYDAARRGELPTLRFGRLLRVPRAVLERMLGK